MYIHYTGLHKNKDRKSPGGQFCTQETPLCPVCIRGVIDPTSSRPQLGSSKRDYEAQDLENAPHEHLPPKKHSSDMALE